MTLIDFVREAIRSRGPLTAAAFIDLALYHPQLGYYCRTNQRSGRGGDFFTSVDVGPLFGELLAVQVAECLDLLTSDARPPTPGPQSASPGPEAPGPKLPAPRPRPPTSDLVEAGAGNGRLARDILDGLERERPDLSAGLALHLVERSAPARAAQQATLGPHAAHLASSRADLPEHITGVVYANELLDAFPVHIVVKRPEGLREIYVGERNGTLVEVDGAPSTPALQAYLDRAAIALEPGGRAEINLAADDWIRSAARAIERGFLLLVDYGHEAAELFSGSHATGTLTTLSAHRAGSRASDWLHEPGEHDITSHVDLTSVRLAAEQAGFTTLGVTDQTYFLMGLGLADYVGAAPAWTNQAKTLMLPGGLGSTHKVMIFGKGVGRPGLKGLSYKVRVT